MSNKNNGQRLTAGELRGILKKTNPMLTIDISILDHEFVPIFIIDPPPLLDSCLLHGDCRQVSLGTPITREWCIWVLTTTHPPLRCDLAKPCTVPGIVIPGDLTMHLLPKIQAKVTSVEIEYDSHDHLEWQVVDSGTLSPVHSVPSNVCMSKFTISGQDITQVIFKSGNAEAIHNACAHAHR